MAIKDYNGSAWSEIGKVYDFNGSANTQIGKVYDNNGSANTLIYTAETQFYPGTGVQYLAANVGAYGDFYANVTNGENDGNKNGTVCYIQVNLTGINSLQITGSFSTGTGGGLGGAFSGCWLANSSQLNYGNARYPYYTIGNGASSTYYTLMWRIGGSTATGTGTTWNVADLSGTYYLCAGVYAQFPHNRCAMSISKIIGT